MESEEEERRPREAKKRRRKKRVEIKIIILFVGHASEEVDVTASTKKDSTL